MRNLIFSLLIVLLPISLFIAYFTFNNGIYEWSWYDTLKSFKDNFAVTSLTKLKNNFDDLSTQLTNISSPFLTMTNKFKNIHDLSSFFNAIGGIFGFFGGVVVEFCKLTYYFVKGAVLILEFSGEVVANALILFVNLFGFDINYV